MLIALLATTGGVFAAESNKPAPLPGKPTVTSPADLQKLIEQFNARRDTLLAQRQELLDQLKNATEEQRKQILEKMQAQQKELIEVQRALGKQIRDDMRKLRPAKPSTGR